MERFCFVDTETTSLRRPYLPGGRRAWDVAVIVRDIEDDGTASKDVEYQWFVRADDLDLPNADPVSLDVGRFYVRHPEYRPDPASGWPAVFTESEVAREVERLTRYAHMIGSVPDFDDSTLAAMLDRNGLMPRWHYHLVCVENLAAGALALPPPWKSAKLAAVLGVPGIAETDRHTALGDARWARDLYDRVMAGASARVRINHP